MEEDYVSESFRLYEDQELIDALGMGRTPGQSLAPLVSPEVADADTVATPVVRGVAGGVRDAMQGFFDFTGEAGEFLQDKMPLGYVIFQDGNLEFSSQRPENMSEIKLPEIESGSTISEGLIRGLSQFVTGMAISPIGKAGKPLQFVKRAAFAETLFDPEQGNLATLLKDLGVDNDFVNLLDSQVDEDADAAERLKARLQQATTGTLEGAVLDGVVAAVRAARSDEGFKQTIKNYFTEAGERAEQRIADRGTQLTSGVDPTATLDELIASLGRAVSGREKNSLTEFIKNNPDGFTLDLSGQPTPAEGFVVAPLKPTEIIVDSQDLDVDVEEQLIDNVMDLTQASGGKVYAGGWFDSKNNRYVLDATQVQTDRDDAIYLAAAGKQDAIFDLGEIDEIRTADALKDFRERGVFDLRRFDDARRNQEQLEADFESTRVQNQRRARDDAEEVVVRSTPDLPENLTPAVKAKESKEAVPQAGNRLVVDDVGKYFVDQTVARHGRKLDPINSEDDFQIILSDGVSDVSYQLNQPETGEFWYDQDIADSFELTRRVIPELGVDEGLRVVLSAMVSATSPLTRAPANWQNGVSVLEEFMEKGVISGRNPVNGKYFGGTRGPVIEKTLKLLNYLLDTKGVQGTAEFLLGEHTVSELTSLRQASGLYSQSNKVPGKAGDQRLGAFIFGEKVGPFMLNINGLKETTADLWYTRTYNRYTGKLFDTPDGSMIGSPRNMAERENMKRLAREIGKQLDRPEQAIQSILWYLEQQIYYSLGVKSARSEAFSDGAKQFVSNRGISTSIRGGDAD